METGRETLEIQFINRFTGQKHCLAHSQVKNNLLEAGVSLGIVNTLLSKEPLDIRLNLIIVGIAGDWSH